MPISLLDERSLLIKSVTSCKICSYIQPTFGERCMLWVSKREAFCHPEPNSLAFIWHYHFLTWRNKFVLNNLAYTIQVIAVWVVSSVQYIIRMLLGTVKFSSALHDKRKSKHTGCKCVMTLCRRLAWLLLSNICHKRCWHFPYEF